jgi:hypothetical protein
MNEVRYLAALLFLRRMRPALARGVVFDCNGQVLVTEGDLVNAILAGTWPVVREEAKAA